MINKKISRLLSVIFLATLFTPLFAQEAAPSKFEMKKDSDGDGVKNKNDKCAATPPGVFVDGAGCPIDTDKDGVADYLDKCPSIPGSAEMNGCTDKDNDGVSDIDDNCPDVPGNKRFKGCPDSDGDGIEDSKDKCPNAKGLDRFQGCPDTDGDGITDANDKCPGSAMGIKVDGNGCAADADGDGVLDADDKCPNTPIGVKTDANGCTADTDGDGITDANDRCPNTQRGIKVDVNGCPADTDGDGVLDVYDKCPGVIGVASNNGCPVVKKETPKRLQFASRKVNFDTKTAIIKTSSYPMLDEVANILSEYPDYNLRLGGHTDSYEKDPNTLSDSRTDAVKTYLLSKGVAESRIVSAGYGKSRPMTSNGLAAGRAQNRRVMLDLYVR